MLYEIGQNPKHESDRRMAFLMQLVAYEPTSVALIMGPDDLLDPDEPITLDNLPVNKAILSRVDTVRWVDGTQLYPAVNKDDKEGIEFVEFDQPE